MTTWLLDTNTASHIIKGDIPRVRQQLLAVPMHAVAISVVTQAELLYGVSKRGSPAGLAARVQEFLARVEVLPWTSAEAEAYAGLRTACEVGGVPLAPLDLMIAAQAMAAARQESGRGETILVTRDKSFARVPGGLLREDWTQ